MEGTLSSKRKSVCQFYMLQDSGAARSWGRKIFHAHSCCYTSHTFRRGTGKQWAEETILVLQDSEF